ncbi:MFS transporter [Pantoea cypripedii]|uniref:MFS transporter n=1 Tax=Pantoea cypripedii TaxID=55209 RepID=A0A1X1EYF5_PANCY|nr:MFS transporter [Pantoea cypripedii]MBP2195105.1 putative MFS family arabinose efflux permease [Pantoea cypripedii]ORM94947.1 hypothetical protein HA50_16980 [Pantoea cypripedii]
MDTGFTQKSNLVLSTLAYAISSAGSVFMHIILAITVFHTTHSGAITALFVALQYMPALLVLIFKGNWEGGHSPLKKWMQLELLAALLTLPLLLFIQPIDYVVVFILLFFRGIVDNTVRVMRTITARYIFTAATVDKYAAVLQAGFNLGIGIAAVTGVLIGSKVSLHDAVIIDIFSFLLAYVLLLFVKSVNPAGSEAGTATVSSIVSRFRNYRRLLAHDKKLMFSAVLPPLSSAFFQGSWEVFVPVFPLKVLGLGTGSIAIAYVVITAAVVIGSTIFPWLNRRMGLFRHGHRRVRRLVLLLSLCSAVFYLAGTNSTEPLFCLLMLALMGFVYQIVWMFGYTGIFNYTPQGELGAIFSISYGFGYCAGSICILLAGYCLDLFNGNFTAVITFFMLVYFAMLGILLFVCRATDSQQEQVANQ